MHASRAGQQNMSSTHNNTNCCSNLSNSYDCERHLQRLPVWGTADRFIHQRNNARASSLTLPLSRHTLPLSLHISLYCRSLSLSLVRALQGFKSVRRRLRAAQTVDGVRSERLCRQRDVAFRKRFVGCSCVAVQQQQQQQRRSLSRHTAPPHLLPTDPPEKCLPTPSPFKLLVRKTRSSLRVCVCVLACVCVCQCAEVQRAVVPHPAITHTHTHTAHLYTQIKFVFFFCFCFEFEFNFCSSVSQLIGRHFRVRKRKVLQQHQQQPHQEKQKQVEQQQ